MLFIEKRPSFWALSVFLCLQAGLASGQDLNTPIQTEDLKVKSSSYHFARSEAELTLEKIIRLDETDDELFPFIVGLPNRKAKLDGYYNGFGLFTKALLTMIRRAEADSVQKNCGGKYIEGELCGLGFRPLTCAQDSLDEDYLFRTDQQTLDTAIITYKWPGEDGYRNVPVARYRLIKKSEHWVLDGVSCISTNNGSFNGENLPQ